MRLPLLLVVLAIAAAFVGGRATSPSLATASSVAHVYTGRVGDVFRVPSAGVSCRVGKEGGRFANVLCQHTPYWHFQAYFTQGWFAVLKRGYPENPVFSTRKP
jgi:hypothetical protein